ncbi:hypothetical protein QE429_003769 [Bacillus sp. SORGH_AS 510]|uniref:anti-sigma factor domain-containing protein n=1 Tax=Bacillus sp. SORGH_AS_0510 TaxID=3041771 RepID=UPI002786AAC6|nr:anti-sigma factor domain-containing protein [Bacillus sp. SORGH_AS_0510]MDQ1146942.1 hypothetical protein [Bacillus sp. SORGH_AS_0510]
MKKGIIMEIEDGFLTLLTPEGEFLRARKQSQPYSIGEEIYFFPIESVNRSMIKRPFRVIFRLKTVWIVMAVLMVFIGTFIPMYQDDKAYAYMSIDANPSVEIGVNKKMQVVKLNGFNKAGKDIISRLKHWKNEDVSELTKVIFAEMKKGGYLKENTQVLISTVRIEEPEEKVEEKLQRKLDKIEASITKEKLELNVTTGNKKGLEEAHKQGFSYGKYYFSQEKSKQQNMDPIGKEKEKYEEKEKTTVPAQTPSVNPMSPGQSKKQNDTQSWDKGEEKGNWDRNANSPGYLKKKEENSKQNQGEYRKQSDSNWQNNGHNNSNHSNNYRQNNSNHSNNYRQNNNSSHNSNNHGNEERNNNHHDNDNIENGNNNNQLKVR